MRRLHNQGSSSANDRAPTSTVSRTEARRSVDAAEGYCWAIELAELSAARAGADENQRAALAGLAKKAREDLEQKRSIAAVAEAFKQ